MIIVFTSKAQNECIMIIYKGASTAVMLICLVQHTPASSTYCGLLCKNTTKLRHLAPVSEWEGVVISSVKVACHLFFH